MDASEKKPRQSLMATLKQAQALAFGPLLFQAALELDRRGLFELLIEAGPLGLRIDEIAARSGTSRYGVTVLLEAGLALEATEKNEGRYSITRLGYLLARDPMTRANFHFVADVCYAPARHLGRSIDEGRAAGLAELGDWKTVYEGLATLGEPARTSWFAFDHFYSDDTFPLVVGKVLETSPRRVLDIGGNTGKFARALTAQSASLVHTIADLPGQIGVARRELADEVARGRVEFHEVDLLAEGARLPKGFDVVWMSQFLCCFSEEEIVSILRLAREALEPGGRIFVLDNFWDVQPNEVSRLCVQATSLYFTCVANGNSRMYDFETFCRLVVEADLRVAVVEHEIGLGHSLLRLERVEP